MHATTGAWRPTPTQSTCLYYCHGNEASKCVHYFNFVTINLINCFLSYYFSFISIIDNIHLKIIVIIAIIVTWRCSALPQMATISKRLVPVPFITYHGTTPKPTS